MAALVSVIIPTRNRAELLRRTLGTVLSQRLRELEVIVVDDASTDGTPAVLDAVADERVRTIRHPERRGVAAARNIGVDAAVGRWVAFLDDDDLWAPTSSPARSMPSSSTPGGPGPSPGPWWWTLTSA